MLGRSLLVLLIAAACHSSSPPNPPQTGVHANPPSVTPDASSEPNAGSGAPGLHAKCGPSDACVAPTTCMHYFGIAGKRGGELTSCEIACKQDADCPVEHRHCVAVADGPSGLTCR
ncbi:MAG TPA: hypothetical protein VGM88_20510 [Kofleriaceae bacterium]